MKKNKQDNKDSKQDRQDKKRVWIIGLLLLIIILAFVLRIFFITRYPLIYGDDGPYYLIYTNALLEGKAHQFQSLIFYYFTFFSLLFRDLTLGIKIGISLLSALTIIPIYLLAKYFTNDERIGLFAALLGAFSATSLMIMSVTLKEVGGLFIGLFLIYSVLKALDEKDKKSIVQWLLAIIILFFLMAFTHISSSLYFLSFLVPFLFYKLIKNKLIKKDKDKYGINISVIIILILVLAILAFIFQQFFRGDLASGIKNLLTFRYEGINFRMSDSYFFLFLFFFVFLYTRVVEKIRPPYESPHISLLIIWLIIGFISTQYSIIDKTWTPRFEQMNYIVLVILCSIGLYYALHWKKSFIKFFTLWACLTILLEAILFYYAGMHYSKPNITIDEYTLFLDMKNKSSTNTVIILDYDKYYTTDINWWLIWMGYRTSEGGQISSDDNPVLLVENTSKSYPNITSEEIISKSESGRFLFVKYPLASASETR